MNNCSPIPALLAMYETYGTITDRDYVISVSGKQQNKTYSVVPMDKVKFRNAKAKPYSEKAVLKMLDKAYPCEDVNDDEDEEDEVPKKKRAPKSNIPVKKAAKKSEPEDDEDDDYDYDEEDDEEDDDAPDYSEMSAKELYKLCKERGIEVKPKKPEKYYIKQLEEYDQAQDDWSDEEEEEEEDWDA